MSNDPVIREQQEKASQAQRDQYHRENARKGGSSVEAIRGLYKKPSGK